MRAILASAVSAAALAAAAVPTIRLNNSALPGLTMPAIGLGTGGYSSSADGGAGAYPECWNEFAGCGGYVRAAVNAWLRLAQGSGAQVRIDSSNSYQNMNALAAGIADSGVPRDQIFLTSKIGSGNAMGYADALAQVELLLTNSSVRYVDALLIHWPTSPANSTEPDCQVGTATYNATACRLNTWRALVDTFNAGKALSIGVSNYNATHLQEIQDAGLPLPALNQIPLHLYRNPGSWASTIAWCTQRGVAINAYSPLGIPDWWSFPSTGGFAPNMLQDPVLTSIAASYGRTPAAIAINWLWQQAGGIVTNPRTVRPEHMADNLAAYNFTLAPKDVAALSARPQAFCSVQPAFYECAPDA